MRSDYGSLFLTFVGDFFLSLVGTLLILKSGHVVTLHLRDLWPLNSNSTSRAQEKSHASQLKTTTLLQIHKAGISMECQKQGLPTNYGRVF